MEINGTWYALRTIDSVGSIYNSRTVKFDITLLVGGQWKLEIVKYETLEQAEQARYEIIKQLEK